MSEEVTSGSSPKFTGFASNKLLLEQFMHADDEFRRHDVYNMKYVWPDLRILFSSIYYFVITEIPEDDPARVEFIRMAGEYINQDIFRFTPQTANKIMDAINFIAHATGILGFKPVEIEKVEWSWEEIRKTDRKAMI
ncbi:MAG: hypothetical protein QXU98_12235 [Candidatus Parvarchaeota archaeon]